LLEVEVRVVEFIDSVMMGGMDVFKFGIAGRLFFGRFGVGGLGVGYCEEGVGVCVRVG
jgi:hypothetical protein